MTNNELRELVTRLDSAHTQLRIASEAHAMRLRELAQAQNNAHVSEKTVSDAKDALCSAREVLYSAMK